MGFVEYLKDMGTRLGFLIAGFIVLMFAFFIIAIGGTVAMYNPLGYIIFILGLAVGAFGVFTMWYSKDKKRRNY